MIAAGCEVQERVELSLEDGLQTSQYEIAAGGSVNEEAEVERYQKLG